MRGSTAGPRTRQGAERIQWFGGHVETLSERVGQPGQQGTAAGHDEPADALRSGVRSEEVERLPKVVEEHVRGRALRGLQRVAVRRRIVVLLEVLGRVE